MHIDEEPYNLATFHANLIARRYGAKTLWFSWQNLARRYPPPFSWIETLQSEAMSTMPWSAAERRRQVWRAKGLSLVTWT